MEARPSTCRSEDGGATGFSLLEADDAVLGEGPVLRFQEVLLCVGAWIVRRAEGGGPVSHLDCETAPLPPLHQLMSG
jgi:hypothetical protein